MKARLQAVQSTNIQLIQENARLTNLIRKLKEVIAKLKERLGQTSKNSSKPPSSDPPWIRNQGPSKASQATQRRKPGAQKGHPGHQRTLIPIENVQQVIALKPDHCQGCGQPLCGEDPQPYRHQVSEIPQITPIVTEYQLHSLSCAQCQAITRAHLPTGVPTGAFDVRATAWAAILTGIYHLSRRQTVSLLYDFFGLSMSLGSVIACEQTVSLALEPAVEQAKIFVKHQSVKHADESSWFEGVRRQKVWLWACYTSMVSVFLIRTSRATQMAKDLLGEVFGVLITDRYAAYLWWPLQWRQLCWAHLKRHFLAFVEAGGRSKTVGLALLKQERKLFIWWVRVRDGTLSRSTFQTYVRPLRNKVQALLKQGALCAHPKTKACCKQLLKFQPALWTFIYIQGVEPTNNNAERIIRPAVLWRKMCFGTHSHKGSLFVERMLSVSITLMQQNRNKVDFISRSLQAALTKQNHPSLLPLIQNLS